MLANCERPEQRVSINGYHPSEDEPYMGPAQLEYFRAKLSAWRAELLAESQATLENLKNDDREVGDEIDQSSRIEMQSLELRTRERYRKLIVKINQALERIRDGSYGYCDMTGEPIGLERLEARPIASLSLYAQELKEQRERRDHYEKAFL